MLKCPSPKNLSIICTLIFLLSVAFYDIFFLNKTFKVTTTTSHALYSGVYGQENNISRFYPTQGVDSAVLEEPIYDFIKKNLKGGILPLWNPHQACGFPLIAIMEVGIFFPLSFIMYLLPNIYAWDVLILTRFFLSGLFTYWFMRHFRFSFIPSLVSAIVFMLSGPMVLLQYWTVNVDILTPFLLLALDKLIQKPQMSSVAFVAFMIGLTFFAGHPEHIFLVNVYGFVFFCYRFISLKKFNHYKEVLSHLSSAYILGIALAAVVLLPFLFNFFSELWHGHPPGVGLLVEEKRDRFITLALPHFFQKEPVNYQWVFAGWWGGYLGILPLALSVLSLFNNQKRFLNYFFVAMGFLIIAKEYGLFFINWIGYLPLFNMCRYAMHTPHLAAFSVAIAAGMGVRTILCAKNISLKAMVFSASLLFTIIMHLCLLHTSKNLYLAIKASVFALLIVIIFHTILWLKDKKILKWRVVGIILIGLVFGELFSYIPRERAIRFDSFPKVPYIEFLKNSRQPNRVYGTLGNLYPNTASGYSLDDLGIFMGFLPKRFVLFVNSFIVKNNFVLDLRPTTLRFATLSHRSDDYLDLLNLRYIIEPPPKIASLFTSPLVQMYNTAKPVYSHEVDIYTRESALPRTFIVHKAIFEPEENKSLEILKGIKEELKNTVLITHEPVPTIDQELQSVSLTDNSLSQIIKYTPNEIVIKAVMEHAGFLVLSDTFHPDWKAYVNGKPSQIFQTDYLIRSIFLPAGQYEVKFVFQPISFYLGALISIFALIRIVVLIVTHRNSRI